MAYKSKDVNRLFFDFETVAMEDVESYLPEVKAPGNIKDEAKIAAAIEAKREEMIERAPLDSDLAELKLIASRMRVDGPTKLIYIDNRKIAAATLKKRVKAIETHLRDHTLELFEVKILPEINAIREFWGDLIMAGGYSVGYNILGFDFPFILKRSMALGIQPGIAPSMIRYRTDPTTDLMPILANWQWGETKRLKWLAKRYGFHVIAEEAEGSQVAEMSDKELCLYGMSDISITVQLYQFMNGVYFNHLGG